MGVLSDRCASVCGVLQRSILRLQLFIMHIKDLSSYIDDCETSRYSDDTVAYVSHHTEVILTLQIEMKSIKQWIFANKLTLNAN